MDRRNFIGRAAASTAGLALGSGCTVQPEDSAAAARAPSTPFDLEEVDVAELQRSMEAGERSARSITEAYLERIEELNLQGPTLRAIIQTNPDAVQIAEELDAERMADGPRGPLHGIPVVIKDNIDTADGMTTTAGSLALEGSTPPRDAFIAEKLRAAGAVILAKANLSEWANFRGDRSSSGWSARGGQCRNPYALDRNPCGSSSGSAVAAAASLAALTIGTETDGSIVCPSSLCGVVGVKPTVGLWSRSGIIPISVSQDTAGPICRTVRDAASLLGPLTGADPRDAATPASQGHAYVDYTQFLDADGLRGARIGVTRNFTGPNPRVFEVYARALEELTAAGATLVDPASLDPEAYNTPLETVVLEYEFKAGLNAYLAALGPDAPMKSLADVIEFNEQNADRELAFFGQETMISSQERGPLTDEEYITARDSIRQLNRDDIDGLLTEHQLDVLVAPTATVAWLTDHVKGDRFEGPYSASPAAIAGYPSVTVPMGDVAGLPVGLSFIGTAWSEPVLLRLAYAYEQATGHRLVPDFRATAG
ncbi:MAG: amidase [Gemmatimonadota bacterium]